MFGGTYVDNSEVVYLQGVCGECTGGQGQVPQDLLSAGGSNQREQHVATHGKGEGEEDGCYAASTAQ